MGKLSELKIAKFLNKVIWMSSALLIILNFFLSKIRGHLNLLLCLESLEGNDYSGLLCEAISE